MSTDRPDLNLLRTKQHFEILDGMRGVAAIAVVIYHFMEIAVPDYNDSFIAHAHLSVDFFFCLSGFVIAYAYDGRIKQIGRTNFFKLRLIRLHPMVIIGSVWGLVAFLFDPLSNLWELYSDRLLIMFASSCFLIPYPVVHERFFNLFHLNPPTWSLFWEYLANIFYALVLVRIKGRNNWLWALVIIAAALLFLESHRSGNLSVGWGGDNVRGGGIRMFFSFMAGILVFRTGFRIKSRLGFIPMAVLLLAVFLVPFSDVYNWIIDPVVVVFYLPFLVLLGAGATLRPAVKSVCRLSGAISYPLYMIHYPFIWLFQSYVNAEKPALTTMGMIIAAGAITLIILAYCVLTFADVPIRHFLKKKLIKTATL